MENSCKIPKPEAPALALNPNLGYNNSVGHVPLAQLDRVSDSDSEGRAFESRMARHTLPPDRFIRIGGFLRPELPFAAFTEFSARSQFIK